MKTYNQFIAEIKKDIAEEFFDKIEETIEQIAKNNNIDSELIWEDLESISDEELLEVAAWQRKEGKILQAD
jgi:vacuolar-type H+-ATPase subunit E/Vma4